MITVSLPLAAQHLAAVHIADGPAMYFGGTIMTFALPMGAFIVITVALFYLFRLQHSGPSLKYLPGASFASFGTREPAPAPPAAVVPAGQETPLVAETPLGPETRGTDPEPEE
jgi:hypothetical protein